jgi:hypothetical protein
VKRWWDPAGLMAPNMTAPSFGCHGAFQTAVEMTANVPIVITRCNTSPETTDKSAETGKFGHTGFSLIWPDRQVSWSGAASEGIP